MQPFLDVLPELPAFLESFFSFGIPSRCKANAVQVFFDIHMTPFSPSFNAFFLLFSGKNRVAAAVCGGAQSP